ncbi:DUF3667 domain-containing protein [Zunongwangia endophytica]|uniref:DUF3667 domain-containing protein n=1 Tax=Zunongwangia endophytica TaxID=1808945 RepID=A0ABV8HDT1_9FLAO|nr:DUF3667 domain-containing protein [Zunongwangia endophytica]MDN3594683.1 DUF3667 domain-containing protein [Zunongwangia endophytica]
MTTCKNCDLYFEGRYCSLCGQKSSIERIHSFSIFNDLQLGLFNIDSGFFFTIKELFIRPGYAIRDYVAGKRVRYFMPVSMLVVLSTIYSFLYHYLDINLFYQASSKLAQDEKYLKLASILDGNYVYYTLATLPIFSFSSWLIFNKQSYNFPEHFVLNTYAACQRIIFHIAFLSILYSVPEEPSARKLITRFELIINTILFLWCYFQFFQLTAFGLIFKTSLSLLFSYLIIISLIMVCYYVL